MAPTGLPPANTRSDVLTQLQGMTELERKAADKAWTFDQVEAGTPANRKPAAPLFAGALVMIYSRGQYRQAVVEKVGPKRAQVVYTTPTSLAEAFRHGWEITLSRKSVPLAETYAPLAAQMQRDQAVDIAGKFAGHFPTLVGEAHSNEGDWELRIRTPNQWLAVASTRDQAAKLWKDLKLMGVLHK